MAASKHNYDLTVYPVQAAVRSASDGAAVHLVTLAHCDCADFTNRRGQLIPVDAHTVAVTVCKHIVAALARVGGWNLPEPEPKVHENLMQAEARELLAGPEVLLDAKGVSYVLRRASGHLSASFTTEDGALCDGLVTYNRLQSRYTVTLKP